MAKAIALKLLEREQLHLAHVFVHPHALGQRGIDVHRLARDAAALVLALDEVERPHIVQPVGQLDQQDAQILAHRQEEFPQVLGRAFAFGQRLDLRQLGNAVHQPRDFGTEVVFDLVDRRQRVLDRVVQQRGDNRFQIELQLGHQAGHLDRMAEIGVATGAFLRPVFLDGIDIGAIEHRLVRIRIVGLHAFDEFILAQHSPPRWAEKGVKSKGLARVP
jgi:hypothetical protein